MRDLLAELMPRYDVRERHGLVVRASADRVYAAIEATDFDRVLLVRALMFVRSLPSLLARRTAAPSRTGRHSTRESLERAGFRVVAESPPHELVLGIEGRFWRASPDVCTPPRGEFDPSRPPPAGTARALWGFRVVPGPSGCTRLTTETRVLCSDAASRRRFLPYWYLIRPGSGVIRHALLRAIRRTAEAGTVRR